MKMVSNYHDYENIPSLEVRYSQMIIGLKNIYNGALKNILERYVGIDIKDPKATILDRHKYGSLMNFYKLHQMKWTVHKPILPKE